MDDRPLPRLLDIMARLRDRQRGCPWDVAQDFASIAPYTIEEAYEVADAIDRDDMPALRDELGDLLFQVVFHAQMAAEAGAFTFDDVVRAVVDKMVRRHPHVFANASIPSAEQQTAAWEAMKAHERTAEGTGTLGGVALALPALLRAQKIQQRAARVGFDWPDAAGPRAKIAEELAELDAADDAAARHEELGDVLFSIVNYARHAGIDAEHALRDATAKFERRFAEVERRHPGSLADLSLAELDALWDAAKAQMVKTACGN